MSIIKSISVGNGDMYYIRHNSDNFSIIDICVDDDRKEEIVLEIIEQSKGKNILRFISTHPDDDHIKGLEYLDDQIEILNFYCVKNSATKEKKTDDFNRYCRLRDSSKKAFYIHKGCTRRWMNLDSDERDNAGINILWPITENKYFREELENAARGTRFNNISPIIKYSVNEGIKTLWMGDLETDFMEKIIDEIDLPTVDILFAPHHGRTSGKVPNKWLEQLTPKIIVIGEAPSSELCYYQDYDTITQNSAGDIIFDCIDSKVHIYVSNEDYSVSFLHDENMNDYEYYLGTLFL